jgi:hypothetical protein
MANAKQNGKRLGRPPVAEDTLQKAKDLTRIIHESNEEVPNTLFGEPQGPCSTVPGELCELVRWYSWQKGVFSQLRADFGHTTPFHCQLP